MHVIPNSSVTIHRGDSIDPYSGEQTNETAVATGVSASIIEQTRQVFDPTTGAPRLIRRVTGRVPDGTGLARNDRLEDEDSGTSYWVQSIRQHSNPIYTSEEIADLARVDATDP